MAFIFLVTVFVISFQAIALPITPTRLTPADGNLNIFALPVGQGDATVIQCPSGEVTIVDIGSVKYNGFMGKEDIAKYFKGHTIRNVFLSHPHKDHINFLDVVLSNLYPKHYPVIYHSCGWTKYQTYVKTTGITTKRIPFCCGNNCPSFRICNGKATMAVLASEYNKCPEEGTNGDSLVLQVQFAGIKVLLPGDFEGCKELINNFLQCVNQHVRSHIFRLAHHGAFNGHANTYEFLKAVRPYYAFSSGGLHGTYHHPRCEVYENLKDYLLTVPDHYYTCYTKSSSNPQWKYDTGFTKTLFVTTVVEPNTNTVINYIIKFRINTNREINYNLQEFNRYTRSYYFVDQ